MQRNPMWLGRSLDVVAIGGSYPAVGSANRSRRVRISSIRWMARTAVLSIAPTRLLLAGGDGAPGSGR